MHKKSYLLALRKKGLSARLAISYIVELLGAANEVMKKNVLGKMNKSKDIEYIDVYVLMTTITGTKRGSRHRLSHLVKVISLLSVKDFLHIQIKSLRIPINWVCKITFIHADFDLLHSSMPFCTCYQG